MHDDQTIAVLGGAGYVGLMTAVGFADRGIRVYCVDVQTKIQELDRELCEQGEPELFEPGFAEALERVRDRLVLTDDYRAALEAADLIFVAVGTPHATVPPDDNRQPHFENYHGSNLVPVRSALDAAVDAGICERHVIVMKSTVPAGTWSVMSERVDARRRQSGRQITGRVPWVSCPEFLREGSALRDFSHPDRIVIGYDDGATAAAERVAALFSGHEARIEYMDTTSAELVKLGANGLLATTITFANEMANLCDLAGADVRKVTKAIGDADDVRPDFLHPGVGFGGSCFPKDVRALRALADDHGERVALLDAVLRVNETQTSRVIAKLEDHLGDLPGRHIVVLGLAFKPNTNDIREALAPKIMEQLVDLGCTVCAFDPHVVQRGLEHDPAVFAHDSVTIADTLDACFDGADAVVLVTEWDVFKVQDWTSRREQMNGTLVIDGRCALDPAAILSADLTYDGIGRRVLGGHEEPMPEGELESLSAAAADGYRAVKAAFGEDIRSLCAKCNANPELVARGIGLDRRIGEHHLVDGRPGEYSQAIEALIQRAADLGYTFELLEALEPASA